MQTVSHACDAQPTKVKRWKLLSTST